MWVYPDTRLALRDALRLSRAMTYKAAVADLPQGGGKGVIMLDPETPITAQRRRAALLDFGDTVDALGGSYITAEDVGISSRDMPVIAQRTKYVAGLARSRGGGGDPSPLTALGVEQAIRACCEWVYASPSLQRRTIGILGLGHVGSRVARRCARAGARLVVTDVDESKRHLAEQLDARWVDSPTALEADLDVLVPCALGGTFDEETVPRLRCRIIAGAANNQLAAEGIADLLMDREILWAPDFVVNAGGLINIAAEFGGYDAAAARRRVRGIADTLREIFEDAREGGVTPLAAALALARQNLQLTS
jgi:leucine dehydrogenase